MIDYDDIKRKAEAANAAKCTCPHDGEGLGYEVKRHNGITCNLQTAVNFYEQATSPDVALQLIKIIQTAKGALYSAYKFDASDAACLALDLIAEIERD